MKKAMESLALVNIIGFGMGSIYMRMAVEPEYYLTVIRDEQTPLAAAPDGAGYSYFPWTVIIMLVMAVLAVIAWYIGRCIRYREYYYEMIKEKEALQSFPKAGWNLIRLKKLVSETENRLVEQIVSGV